MDTLAVGQTEPNLGLGVDSNTVFIQIIPRNVRQGIVFWFLGFEEGVVNISDQGCALVCESLWLCNKVLFCGTVVRTVALRTVRRSPFLVSSFYRLFF